MRRSAGNAATTATRRPSTPTAARYSDGGPEVAKHPGGRYSHGGPVSRRPAIPTSAERPDEARLPPVDYNHPVAFRVTKPASAHLQTSACDRVFRLAVLVLIGALVALIGAVTPVSSSRLSPAQATPAGTSKKHAGSSATKRDANGMYVSSPVADGTPAPKPWAASWALGSLDSGDILAQKKPEKRLWPASVLKLLTGLALIDEFPDRTKKYKATHQCEEVDGTAVGLEKGRTYTVDELFHAMLMMSANDAAYALADAAGGQKHALALMNKKARQIGMNGTVAKTPNGLDAKGQAMTARDLLVLAKHFVANKYLMQVVGTKTYRFDTGLTKHQRKAQKKRAKRAKKLGRKFTKTPRFYEIANHTQIVGKLKGGLGLKNGYTIKARGSFVAAAKRGGKTYAVAILKSTDQPRKPAIDMLNWAFNQKSPHAVGNIDFDAIDKTRPRAVAKPAPTGTTAAHQAARARQDGALSDSAALWGGGLLLAIVVIGIGVIVAKRSKHSS